MQIRQDRPWLGHYPPSINLDFEIPEKNLYSLLDVAAKKYPEHTAIIFENEKINYLQLKNMVDRLAGAWKQLGAAKGERLGLMVSNHPLYVVSYYASLKLGLMIVQINPHYTVRELLEIFNDATVTYLVTEPECLEKVAQVEDYSFKEIFVTANGTGYPGLPELIERSVPLAQNCPIEAQRDIAVIQYTGGTTGKKKGAMLTHYNLIANVIQSKALYGERMLTGAETILTATPLYHVYGMTSGMNLSIYIGAANLLVNKFEVEKILKQIETYRPTLFPGVPKMYHAFAHYPDIESYDLTCFKMCTSGSAPLPIEIMKKFEHLTGVTVGEGYGLSETSPTTHRNPPDGVSKIGSIGIPLPQTDCRIVDDNGEDVPERAVGELLLKGPQVMLGYWNKPEETQNALRDGWFYTGDLATMDEEGYFYIVGRKKEMILVGGFNVYPQEVEGVLYEHSAVLEAAVVGIPDKEIGEIVTAYIVPKPGISIDFDDLREHCYRHLTRYKVPKKFEVRDTLPRNSVGKLLKRILVEEATNKTKA
ncbi:long-chain fatty acid--CoA ligase [Neobacillus niacini]|uniref:long-chain-fatty-acid--CoA ligase n=1 Tax=Neobacillus niacini TaxID=86668 RepID=UPI0021CB2D9D|nr:long-chain fatty acid--CoA ligase [Neobacillus niacini]MCM3764331.1 long-chain fatty acid--CoA ligase [Neobacillus niacini]